MPTTAAETSSIVIRDARGQAEMRAVEELQKEVWGIPDLDVVPTTQLVAAQAAGGVLIGAFDGETLAGFAYGFPGYEHGRATHHSHMLAVKPSYRSFNLGRKLKLAQRTRVLAQGIETMTWTFDPLQSLNAYFNFSKLGVISDRYIVNFYGAEATSFLHRNGTDRLWVTWNLASRRVSERLDKTVSASEFGAVKPLVELGEGNAPRRYKLSKDLSPERIAIEIPADINALERQSGELAFEWREATRRAFTEAFAAGYLVEDFYRLTRGDRQFGTYLLSREKTGQNHLR
ncbi:MAG: GNAT family N-acetyltransferase [Acidobacteriota bacterium]|nr:GNAT family N-acetyltransferase [Acidobacteriota bacterium]